MACKYIVTYTSAVTGSRCTSGCPDKRTADKEAKALRHEGSKDVCVYPYTHAKLQ